MKKNKRNKKKLNKKGFSLVELLAAVTLLGVISVIAVPAVYRYVTRSRNLSINTAMTSAYEAAESYMIDQNELLEVDEMKTIEVSELVRLGYLEVPKDPSGGATCYGEGSQKSKVVVHRIFDSPGGIMNYIYYVTINCPSSGKYRYVYPKGNILEDIYSNTKDWAKANNCNKSNTEVIGILKDLGFESKYEIETDDDFYDCILPGDGASHIKCKQNDGRVTTYVEVLCKKRGADPTDPDNSFTFSGYFKEK